MWQKTYMSYTTYMSYKKTPFWVLGIFEFSREAFFFD